MTDTNTDTHTWQRSRITGTVTCSGCNLLPVGPEDYDTDCPIARLEYLRGEIRHERISYSELCELQTLAEHIDESDVELLEWAGVPEFRRVPDVNGYYACSECETNLVDSHAYTDEELQDPEELILCTPCAAAEAFERTHDENGERLI